MWGEITRSASQEKTLARIDAIRTEIMRQGPLASNRPNEADLVWGASPWPKYKEQWLKLLDMSDEIRAFISANEAQLKAKD
jgi:hypothetical protein